MAVPDCSSEKEPDFKYLYTHSGYLISQNLSSFNTLIHKYSTLLTESNTVEEDRLGTYSTFYVWDTAHLNSSSKGNLTSLKLVIHIQYTIRHKNYTIHYSLSCAILSSIFNYLLSFSVLTIALCSLTGNYLRLGVTYCRKF